MISNATGISSPSPHSPRTNGTLVGTASHAGTASACTTRCGPASRGAWVRAVAGALCKFTRADSFAAWDRPGNADASHSRSDRCTTQVLLKRQDAARPAGTGPNRLQRNRRLNHEDWDPYVCDYHGDAEEPRVPAGDWRRCSKRLGPKQGGTERCAYAYLPATDLYFNRNWPGLNAVCRMCNRAYCERGNARRKKAKEKDGQIGPGDRRRAGRRYSRNVRARTRRCGLPRGGMGFVVAGPGLLACCCCTAGGRGGWARSRGQENMERALAGAALHGLACMVSNMCCLIHGGLLHVTSYMFYLHPCRKLTCSPLVNFLLHVDTSKYLLFLAFLANFLLSSLVVGLGSK